VKLLPLAQEPLAAPTDRDMLPSERREFVRTHRTCIFGYARRADGPSMSVVYYIPTDEDELLISTMRGRSKTKAVARTGKVSLCVLDERWPFAYLQVYCDARIDDDPALVVDVMMAVAGRMSGQTLPEEARPVCPRRNALDIATGVQPKTKRTYGPSRKTASASRRGSWSGAAAPAR